MKESAYHSELKNELKLGGLKVDKHKSRSTVADVQAYQCPISGDCVPRLTFGQSVRYLSIFICTARWEIRTIWYQSVFLSMVIKMRILTSGAILIGERLLQGNLGTLSPYKQAER
jgi:hypothetical protein